MKTTGPAPELTLEEPMTATAVATREDRLPDNVISAASMMEVIARASSDPNTNVEKLERLMAMAERVEARAAEKAFNEAMMAAQEEMEPIRKDAANTQTKSRYATYEAIDAKIRPIYVKHGFALSFNTGDDAPPDVVRVLCYVTHRSGHTRLYRIDMPADGKGAKGGDVMTKTHATGSAMSYGQRYLVKGIFNIVVANDDDGNAAGANEPISAEDMEWVKDMIDKSHSDLEKFCTIVMKVESLAQLTKRDMPKAREALNEALNFWQRKTSKAK